ncbi:MAG: hypothetical protein WDN72_04195 [Alphaproteobacteria bacterium]
MANHSTDEDVYAVLHTECVASHHPELESYLRFIIKHESNGRNIACIGGASTASGYCQFVDGTWQTVSGLPGRAMDYSAQAQCDALIKYALMNKGSLQGIGTDKDDILSDGGRMYLAHFLGTTGAEHVLEADRHATLEELVHEGKLKKGVLTANAGITFPLHGKPFGQFTVEDLCRWSSSVVDGGTFIEDHNRGILSPDDEKRDRTRIFKEFGYTDDQIAALQHLQKDGGFLGQIVFALIVSLVDAAMPKGNAGASPDLDIGSGLPANLPVPRPNPARAPAPVHAH